MIWNCTVIAVIQCCTNTIGWGWLHRSMGLWFQVCRQDLMCPKRTAKQKLQPLLQPCWPRSEITNTRLSRLEIPLTAWVDTLRGAIAQLAGSPTAKLWESVQTEASLRGECLGMPCGSKPYSHYMSLLSHNLRRIDDLFWSCIIIELNSSPTFD